MLVSDSNFFNVVLVRLGEELPIDVFEVVAVTILAMLTELDAESMKRAGVQAV